MSTHQPACAALTSLAMRQRRRTGWPIAEAGYIALVVMNVPLSPVHAARPAIALVPIIVSA